MKWMQIATEIAASMKCQDTPRTHATKTTKTLEPSFRSVRPVFVASPKEEAEIEGHTPENDATKTTKTPDELTKPVSVVFVAPFLGEEQKNLPAQTLAGQKPTEAPADGDGQDWQALDQAYQAHHFACPQCSAAGQGRGRRCDTGLALWRAYSDAPMPTHPKRAAVSPAPPPRPAHAQALTAEEIDTLLDRIHRFMERGLNLHAAQALADRLALRDREDQGLRACPECQHGSGGKCEAWAIPAKTQPLGYSPDVLARCQRFK